MILRQWDDVAANTRIIVRYTPADTANGVLRGLAVERTVLNSQFPQDAANDGPQDDVLPGSELYRATEDNELIVLVASDFEPYATYAEGTPNGTRLVLTLGPISPPSAPAPAAGSVDIAVSGISGPVNSRVFSLPSGAEVLPAASTGIASPATSVYALPAGDYRFEYRAQQAPFDGRIILVTVPPYVPPIATEPPACRDPEADNYVDDPNRPSDFSLCVYSPRVVQAAELPDLVANGRPVLVTFNSASIPGAQPAPARAFLTLENFSPTLENAYLNAYVEVNGYRFTSGPLITPTNFLDAPTLLDALLAVPVLVGSYEIALSNDDQILLTARVNGTPGNLSITTTPGVGLEVYAEPGVNQYRSQARTRFGVWVEVWTGSPQSNPSTYADLYTDAYRDTYGLLLEDQSPSQGTGKPILAQRLEIAYREDNNYTFDIAPALRQFTGHAYPQADGSCPDRLCSYFLKYGEIYQLPGGIRRQQTKYQTGVGWALDAVELVPDYGSEVAVFLTSRPGVIRLRPGFGVPVLLSNNGSGDAYALGTFERTFGGDEDFEDATVAYEGVSLIRPDWENYDAALGGELLDGSLQLAAVSNNDTLTPFGRSLAYEYLRSDATALTFANGQGGFDTVFFEGIREEITKRSSATVATATGSLTRRAELSDAFRLHSGLLSREEFLWLRRELGNSPSAWLETEAGPLAVTLTAYATEADEVLGNYTVSIDCEPELQLIYGLTN